MKYGRYDHQFKVEAVELALQPDVQTQEVASRLGIHPFMLSRWKKKSQVPQFGADFRCSEPSPLYAEQ